MGTQVMRTWKPTAAGFSNIVAGAFGILFSLVLIRRGETIDSLPFPRGVGEIGLPLAIVAIIGGIFSLKRKLWGLALTGSICAIFSWLFILGILSVIFVSMSRQEFGTPVPPANPGQPS